MPLRAILFDLDGTLVQTREASWSLFAQTNEKFALGIDTRASFFELFEENFFRGLRRTAKGDVEGAVAHFLDLLRRHYCPPLIPGMSDVIKALASRFTLGVISTNAIIAIRRILASAGVAHCFAHVFAGDVEPDKSACIRQFLSDPAYVLGRRCSPGYEESCPPTTASHDEVVLVTDTVGDVKEARASGIRAIGVAWGMHGEDALLSAGAEKVALWPQELVGWLVPPGAAPVACGCTVPAVDDRLARAGEIRRARRAATPVMVGSGPRIDPELLRAVAAVGTRASTR